MIKKIFQNKAFLCGLGWTAATAFFGLIGIVMSLIWSAVDKTTNFSIEEILASGTLFLFSATLAAAVAVDSFFHAEYGGKEISKLKLQLIYVGAFLVVVFSFFCYLPCAVIDSANVEIETVATFTLAILASSVIVAIAGKTVLLG